MAVLEAPDYFHQLLTLAHIGLAYASAYFYFTELWPTGNGWPCTMMHIALLPLYKPILPSF
eukprot:12671697-Heterocapsa_arctica.AAC.1